jgi:hypothetical protein
VPKYESQDDCNLSIWASMVGQESLVENIWASQAGRTLLLNIFTVPGGRGTRPLGRSLCSTFKLTKSLRSILTFV